MARVSAEMPATPLPGSASDAWQAAQSTGCPPSAEASRPLLEKPLAASAAVKAASARCRSSCRRSTFSR